MKTTTYIVKISGETPLLMHNDNLSWSEKMKAWAKDPANREGSVAGDDRSPAWRWIGNLYLTDRIVVPADNLMTLLREGGKRCPTGKGQKTFKAQTQSGLVVDQGEWPLIVRGKQVLREKIDGLIDEADFDAHEKLATELGFMLFVKRAKIGMAKHVRVRPRFDVWECQGSVTVMDEEITEDVLKNILTFAGRYSGLGDWRPSSPKSPGPYGKFTATVREA